MATLPTITITDEQSVRILEAYKALFGTDTQADTVKAFKKWLAQEVRSVVVSHESYKLEQADRTARDVKLADLSRTLPDPNTVV